MLRNELFDLTGKIALVSGASRGIGQAIAEGLAAFGAHVIVTSRKLEACEQVAQGIRDDGGQATALKCHAGNMDDIDTLFDAIDRDFGRLDILINCGAASPYFGPIADTEVAAFDKTVEVNLRGPFFMSAKAVHRMKQSGGGAILNVASINALRPGPYQGIYSITKAAMVNMTKAFAREYGKDNIRVNAILPGLIETKLSSALTSDKPRLEALLKTFPISRLGQPIDMVGGVIYLVSDAAAFTTGETLVMDGGATI